MKKKIVMFAVLLSLMVALVPTYSARAEEEYVIPAGKYAFNLTLTEFDLLTEYTNWRLPYYYLYKCGSGYVCLNVFSAGTIAWCESEVLGPTNGSCGSSHSQDYSLSSGWSKNGYSYGYGCNRTRFFELKEDVSVDSRFYQWFCLNVEDFTGNLKDYYYLNEFCVDAGINCSASTLESADVAPFTYNRDYLYIVRQSTTADSLYRYYLTQVNVSRDEVVFPTYNETDGKVVVGLNSLKKAEHVCTVRQYGYDESGQGWVLIDDVASHSVSKEYPVESINCVASDSNVLVYTSRELYSDTEMLEVAVPRSVEYEEVPVITPTPEPTPTPVVPSGGFDIVMYSSQIKAEVKADSVNMRDKPSLESNVVASFIKTWDVDVLGYVYADDGAVWYYCKTVRDDMEYIGFIKAEYLTVLSVENNDFNIDFGDINLEDTPELITTAKNSFIELLGFVGVVPMMIAVVFGFLPSWCLGIVGVTVVVLCFLAIIKRG